MKEFDFTTMGRAIKTARLAKGISQIDVADFLGITARHLQLIENHGQIPSFKIFYNLVLMFDISVDSFFFSDSFQNERTKEQIKDALDSLTEIELEEIETKINVLKESKII